MIDELKTDYKDDVLATSQQGKRTFNIVGKNGEILFEDVHIEDTSRYLQVGDEYGQSIINEQNSAINQLSKGTGYVFDTYAEYLEAYQGGEIPVGAIVYIKEGSVDGTITALQVKYNDSNVKLALDTLSSNLGSKSSASAVTGDDAFSKIATLNNNKQNKTDNTLNTPSKTVTGAINSIFNDMGFVQDFRYSASANPTGANHNMWCNGTIASQGVYLLYGVFVFPNDAIETNWQIIASSKSWIYSPVHRRPAGGGQHTVTVFGVSELKAGSQVGIFGDGTVGTDGNYWRVLAILLKKT